MMSTHSIVIGTAGHIDHGKTALIRALTGVDCDRLLEEKKRGITIDLGYASMDVVTEGQTPLQISFVDVPGHKHFIRNMLAGGGCVASVLLVISAEEGIKPQTEEHLAICSLLGMERGVVAITKVDAVSSERLEEVSAQIRTFLERSFLGRSHAAVIPLSARTGEGVADIRRELISLAATTTIGYRNQLLRLPLDRAFVMKGFGAVVTGTLLSGVLRVGQSLVVEPGGRTVRVRGMQIHNRAEEHAHAGSRVALNLAGVDAVDVWRGQTLVEQQTLNAVTSVDVEATLLPGCGVLKHRAEVHFHAFTSDVLATVSLYNYKPIEAGEQRLLRLTLSHPVVLVPGDRFVLRNASPATTIGGGTVVDAHPLLNLRKAKCLVWLEKLREAPAEQQLLLRIERRAHVGIEYGELAIEVGLERKALQCLANSMMDRGILVEVSDTLLITHEQRTAIVESVVKLLQADAQHAGLKRSEIRGQLGLRGEVFDFVIHQLAEEGTLAVAGELIYSPQEIGPTTRVQLTPCSAVEEAFRSTGLATPLVADVAAGLNLSEVEMRKCMTVLLREGLIVKMGNNEVYIHRDALHDLRAQLAELRGKLLDVSSFKQLTGVTRKYAIPLLEYLDRERLTRRAGDRRLVL